MSRLSAKWGLASLVVVILLIGAAYWKLQDDGATPDGFAKGNGRIEAVSIDVSSKVAGRISKMLVKEGDVVEAGQPLAEFDSRQLQVALVQAQAERKRAVLAVDTAKIGVEQAQAELRAAEAAVKEAEASNEMAQKKYDRTSKLAENSTASQATLDADRAQALSSEAAISLAEAQRAAAAAAINTAKAGVIDAQAAVEVADAAIESIKVQLSDMTLTAPRDGRVQYIVAREGEIVGAGGRVLNLADLGDVYMSIFLPTREAGRIALGTPARVVLDAAPDMTVPAKVTYVADVAQFTPKTVETEAEREKLMFRVKVTIDPDLLKKYSQYVKTGLPGIAYVKLDPDAAWPASLEANLVK